MAPMKPSLTLLALFCGPALLLALSPPARADIMWWAVDNCPASPGMTVCDSMLQTYPNFPPMTSVNGNTYIGVAMDITTVGSNPSLPAQYWDWGFWDPPLPDPGQPIFYYEIFTGGPNGTPDSLASTPTPLPPAVQILSNQVIGTVSGQTYEPNFIVDTTVGNLPAFIDPGTFLVFQQSPVHLLQPGDRVVVTQFRVPLFDVLQAVPEPSTLALVGAGVSVLAAYGQARRRRVNLGAAE